MAAPTLNAGATKGVNTANTLAVSVTLPAFTDGDTLYIAIASDAPTQVFGLPLDISSSSTGWTVPYSNVDIPAPTPTPTATFAIFRLPNAVHSRFDFDGTNYTIICPVTTTERQAWQAWSVSNDGGIDAQGTTLTGSGATATIPAVTTVTANCLIIGAILTDQVSTPHGAAVGYTKLAEISGASATSISVFSTTLAAIGTQASATVAITAEQWAGISFAIKPAVAGNVGTAALALGPLVVAAAAVVKVRGTATLTLGALTVVSAGTVAVRGTANIALGALTISALGLVGGGTGRIGAATLTLGALPIISTGKVAARGTVTITLGALSVSATGTVGPPLFAFAGGAVPPMGALFLAYIEDASGLRLGGGPIVTGIKWTYKQKLSQAGEWSLEVPLAEVRLQSATLKRRIHCYTRRNGQTVWLGGGIVESRGYGLSGQNVPVMTLSGPDLLRELAGITVNFEVPIYDPVAPFDPHSPTPPPPAPPQVQRTTKILNNIFTAVPAWAYDLPVRLPEITARFVHESVLNALIAVCDKTGAFFWMEPYLTAQRKIVVAAAPIPSSIIATNLADPLAAERNANVCLISDIERVETSWDARNRLIVYGAGDGKARLTLAAATLWPDGSAIAAPFAYLDPVGRAHIFVLDKTTNTITDTAAAAVYGQDEIAVAFKDIAPITNNDADTIAAANTLVSAAINQLVLGSLPTVAYRLSVAALRATVHPGMSIRVIAKKYRDDYLYINVNETLLIQEVNYSVDADGEKVTGLTVATTWKAAKTGATVLSEQIQKLSALEAHPQMGPTDPVICYREDIDDDFGASFPFWISNNTTTLNSVIVRFKLDKLRSTVKTIGGTANGSVTIAPHHHGVTLPGHSHGVTLPSHSHNTTIHGTSGSPTITRGFARVLYFDPTDDNFYADIGSGTDGSPGSNGGGGASITSGGGGGTAVTSDDGGGQANVPVDISSALTAVYGIYVDPAAAYGVADLAWEVNGAILVNTPASIGFDWYEMDITNELINPLTLRPIQAANTVVVAVGSKAGRRVRVTVQIEIRKVIQAIAVFDNTGALAAGVTAASILTSGGNAISVGVGAVMIILAGTTHLVTGQFEVFGTVDAFGDLEVS